jgi:acetylornithine deacetylase/succinyl-diaminopimelate desuccinylase-like protein
MNLYEILKHISIPRPNHSDTLDKVSQFIQDTLAQYGIPFKVQHVTIYPYNMLIAGLSCFILALLFAWCIKKQKPLFALVFLVAIPCILIGEFELVKPVVSWIAPKESANIIISFPQPHATRTLVLLAHYDSKTDLFDHLQRAKIYQFIVPSILVGLLLLLLIKLSKKFQLLAKPLCRRIATIIVVLFSIEWLLVALAMGGFIFLKNQSSGAIDNASSVVALLGLANDIKNGAVANASLNIEIVFTTGEEINLQGAKWYVKKLLATRKVQELWVINLELVGEPGNMVYWQKAGVMLKFYSADSNLIEKIEKAYHAVTKKSIGTLPRLTDDSIMFMRKGIPAITVGFANEKYGVSGLHSPKDNLQRVSMDNIHIMIKTLRNVITTF